MTSREQENALREAANEHQPDNHGPDICGDPECFASCVVDGCDWPCETAWLRNKLAQAEARIKAVRGMHQSGRLGEVWGHSVSHPDDHPVCEHCMDPDADGFVSWPCPTICALDGDA